jgi:transcriptional regulator with XRE-family HTH domain
VDNIRFGRSARALRRRRRLRQRDLAALVGCSKSTIGRIERGQIDRIAYGTLVAVGRVLSARVDLDVSWNGEGLDRLLDEAHVALVDSVVAKFQAVGWETAVEASFSIGGERGSVDVLAWHRGSGAIAVSEVKSVVPDAQATIAPIDRKGRLAPLIARDRGWTCRIVARFLFIGDSRTSRRRIEAHEPTWRAAFPTDRATALAWLESPTAPAPAALVFIRPASRRAGAGRGIGRRVTGGGRIDGRATAGRERIRVPRQSAA